VTVTVRYVSVAAGAAALCALARIRIDRRPSELPRQLCPAEVDQAAVVDLLVLAFLERVLTMTLAMAQTEPALTSQAEQATATSSAVQI
jgi:hypothetical protein